MAGGKSTGEARFGIKIDSNAKQAGEEGASAIDQLRQSISASTNAIKQNAAMLRNLKGSSDEIKKAKSDLKAKIDGERNALAQNTLQLIKSGASYEKAAHQTKKLGDETKASGGILDTFKGVIGATGLDVAVAGGAIAALAAAALAVVGAIAAATYAFGEWLITIGSATRSAQLLRVAFNGSEEDAKRLGNQVDKLARSLPTARDEINQMASELSLAGLGGQTLVDTLHAASQAGAALGGGAANKVREFVERSKLTKRFSLGPLETQGLGVSFGDVASALAANTKTSVQEAAAALVEGRVTLGDGAAALRSAMEKRFAGVNLAKMLDLDVLKLKFKETFSALVKDINLEPLLKAFQDLLSLFDQSTETGADLKVLVEFFGNGLVDAIVAAKPIVKGFFEGLIGASLDLEIAFLELKFRLKDTFGDKSILDNIDLLKTGVIAGKVAVYALAAGAALLATSFVALGATTALALTPLVLLGSVVAGIVYAGVKLEAAINSIVDLGDVGVKIGEKLKATNWSDIGKSISDGLFGAIDAIDLSKKGAELGTKLKDGFKNALGIHSPSRVFAELGLQTAAGFEQGVDAGADKAHASIDNLVGRSGGNGSPAPAVPHGDITININMGERGHGGGDHRADGDSEFIARLTNAIELELQKLGLAPA